MSTWWERRLQQGSPPPVTGLAPPPAKQITRADVDAMVAARYRPPPDPADLCPDCGSENYLAATKLTAKRCYDCGYPVVQSGTGLSSGRTDGTTKKAAQVQTGGYSPGVIVGRVE